jgi:hypothetical protein
VTPPSSGYSSRRRPESPVTNEFVKCLGGWRVLWREDLSLELGLTKDGELRGNTKLQSDLSMLNRFVGVRDAGLERARSRTAGLLYRLLAPRQDTGAVASERGALDANLDIRGWTPRRRGKFRSEELYNLRACFGFGFCGRVGKTWYSEGPTFKSRLDDRLLVIFPSFHKKPRINL